MTNLFLQPFYNALQTIPAFSYLVLTLLFFGLGPGPAITATIIYAMPPMARAAELGLLARPVSMTPWR